VLWDDSEAQKPKLFCNSRQSIATNIAINGLDLGNRCLDGCDAWYLELCQQRRDACQSVGGSEHASVIRATTAFADRGFKRSLGNSMRFQKATS